MKNSEIIRQVEEQALKDREIQEKNMPRPGYSRDVAPNMYEGPIVNNIPPGGQKIFDIKTKMNKIPVVLKLKSPFMVWPGDELHLSLYPPYLAATGIKGERYSALEINLKGKGH